MKIKYYVPFFISKIKEFNNLYDSEQIEIDRLSLDLKELLNQFFVNTATFSLSDWEEFVGINTNTSKSIEERRASILAKLRGQGTTTVEMLENVCKSYVKNVEIIEHPNDYSFEISLKSNNGFPSLLKDLYNNIEEIKPAHLAAHFKLTSITNMNIYYGNLLLTGEEITVYPYSIKELETKANIHLGIAQDTNLEQITIYPKEGN